MSGVGLVEVTWLLPDGRGGGRDGDRIVRIPGALPGDRVRYEIERTSGRGVEARLLEIVAPSLDRRVPPCPWDAACGGCDLAALQPEARVQALRRSAAFALRAQELPPWIPSPRQTAHRARIKLGIEGGRVGYRAARSHDLVEIGACAVARPEVQEALTALRRVDLTGAEHVEIRSDGMRAVYAFSGSPDPRQLSELGHVAVNGRAVHGDPTLTLAVEGVRLRASPRSFYQVNLEVNTLLVRHVVQTVGDLRPERVLDLYAGIGNLSLPLARLGAPVVAVELEGQAISDLRAQSGDLPVKAVAGKVERFDFSREPFDVAVLDPPRAGAPGVLRRLVRQRPRALVYVSCHLPSAVRDVQEATRAGYALTDVRCFDMFPDTRHFETVLVLERT